MQTICESLTVLAVLAVTTRALDDRLLAILPPALVSFIPCHLTHKSGISHPVKQFMERSTVNGQSFMDFSESVRELIATNHLIGQLQARWLGMLGPSESQGSKAVQTTLTQYYARSAGESAQQAAIVSSDVTPPAAPPPKPAVLPAPPVAPCGRYYSDILLNSATAVAQRQLFKLLLQATPAARGVIKFDHCHKPAKLMRMPDTSKTKACVGTAFLLDGIGRVLGWWHVSPMASCSLLLSARAAAGRKDEHTRVVVTA